MSVRAMITTTGRLLVAHWPALLAWYLAGTLGRYLGIELAGFVGGYSAVGGILLLPLAILAKLVSVVAMFLVLRDGLVRLGVIAPVPTDAATRRTAFRDALLSAVLPFIAVYAALGFLVDDVAAYLDTALQVKQGRRLTAIVEGTDLDLSGTVDQLSWEPWTLAVVVLAFAGRWAWKRWQSRLPRWTSVVATYLEGLWIFLTAYFVGEALGSVTGWVESRQAMAWLGDFRAMIGGWFAPLGWAWDAVGWVIGELGTVMLVPLAWLTVAGVVFGQAVSPQGVQWRGAVIERTRSRYAAVPQHLRRRLTDIGAGVGSRFRPIWRAIVLMWRSGPILIGAYVLLYAVLMLADQWLTIGVTRLVGPHDFYAFWRVFGTPLLLIAPMIIEPVRTALIAAAYDGTIGALIGAPTAPTGADDPDSGLDDQPQEPGQLVGYGHVDGERPAGVGGQHVGHDEGEGPRLV
jgi:hypothetical protein